MDETTSPYLVLEDKLPTYYSVCIQVKSAASALKSETKKQAIRASAKALYNLWVRSFGRDLLYM